MRLEGESTEQYVERLKRTYRERRGIAEPENESAETASDYWEASANNMLFALTGNSLLTVSSPGSGKSGTVISRHPQPDSTHKRPRPWDKKR